MVSMPSRRTAKIVVDLMLASVPRRHEEGFSGEGFDGFERLLRDEATPFALSETPVAAGVSGKRAPGNVRGLKIRALAVLQVRDHRPEGAHARKLKRL